MNFYFRWLNDSDRCVLFIIYENKILDIIFLSKIINDVRY
jgi:hypothetical protein